ncbi:hypothetical protein FIA56_11895 [Testudinibacter sp. TR-2022]|uniref:hypothetical protein n=1 Tax=Testudinibacter sp. TR-2022 TaxID=2585029 RepID=UPI0011186242|nr:hypothetical protein [Testudinibacter sp. TR-2022]TNH10881.1 hypothetical protein FIA56_11895 [Testudinibacter sp. TR-2022]
MYLKKHTEKLDKIRPSIDGKGNIHGFFNESKGGRGAFHWAGSTGYTISPMSKNRELKKFNREIKRLEGENK